jgi:UDP-N-acetylglucosamine--N-acetylmuramyl-(pentapeptide) pyrophosphoryl-undecaprenol N-acetylglucosamine transferase
MKILFSGGGTLGSVTPLLAIIDRIKRKYPEDEIFWVTTKDGVEKDFLDKYDVQKYALDAAKLRRYFSLENFKDIFKFIRSFGQAYKILKEIDPDIIVSAGAYVSVPLVIIGKLKGKKVLIHQQDIKVGLANRIMSWFSDKITLSFWESGVRFNQNKVYLTGNPSRFNREQIKNLNRLKLLQKYNLKSEKPILLVLGGSSGSVELNQVVYKAVDQLTNKYQILHVTGQNKNKKIEKKDYYQYNFLDKELLDFMFLADIVVSRAGFATLTELSYLSKCAIIVPLKGHQEINAGYFYKEKAIELCDSEHLVQTIFKIAKNKSKKESLIEHIDYIMPKNAVKKITNHIYGLTKENYEVK